MARASVPHRRPQPHGRGAGTGREAVSVSGTVADVRPYLQHAGVAVAPLRLARGVQNKVLEAMAMGRPVVCAGSCIEAIGTTPGHHILAADQADMFSAQLNRLLAEPAWAEMWAAPGGTTCWTSSAGRPGWPGWTRP